MPLDLKTLIRSIPDYPKPGILFRDITTLIEHPEGFRQSIETLADRHPRQGHHACRRYRARGFIFGAGVAIALGVGFVPVRKKGKLPGETIGQNYALEYGVDTIEIHADVLDANDNVLLIDDLIATGGTALAAVSLIRRTKAKVDHAGFVIDLFDLAARRSCAMPAWRWRRCCLTKGIRRCTPSVGAKNFRMIVDAAAGRSSCQQWWTRNGRRKAEEPHRCAT